jgi:thiol-disulfide isomerase/thioredoxin
MAPIIEQVAEELKGSVNVARVDIMQNRDLGTRFTIVGFPTLLLFSQGHVFTFKGRRSVEEVVEFARGGFQLHEAEIAPKELGLFAEFEIVTRHAYKEATKDLLAGNFYTINVFCMAMPIIFGFLVLIVVFIPIRKGAVPLNSRDYRAEENPRLEIPISSRARPPTSATDSYTKKTKTSKQE